MSKALISLSVLFLFVACATEKEVDLSVDVFENVSSSIEANIMPQKPKKTTVLVANLDDAQTKVGSNQLISDLPSLTPEIREALEAQRKLVRRQSSKKIWRINGASYTRQDFIQVIDDLLSGRYQTNSLKGTMVARGGEVRFTGYYSPEIQVSSKKTKTFRYPILAYPKDVEGKMPSRKEIEQEGALEGKTEVIAWAAHALDVYTLQLQGSGFVRFEDGKRHYLAYDGTNRYPYQSIEQALHRMDSTVTDLSLRGLRKWISEKPKLRDTITTFNPNYGFFKLSKGRAIGAAGIPLIPMISVAADPNHYPLGSVLVANVPRVNQPGIYDTRLLLVQDTGGAVKGSHHLDLYTGVGESALDIAERTAEYGEVYMLSPI